ncbi:MAG: hypothetical protein ACK5JM_05610, partial [Rhodoblastus sp.]
MAGRAIKILGGGVAALALLAGASVVYLNSGAGGATIARMIEAAASGDGRVVKIGSIENLLSSAPRLREITLADSKGAWLAIDQVNVSWSPSALFAMKVDIDRIDIGQARMSREPEPGKSAEKSGSGWPDLPVRVRLGELRIAHLLPPESWTDGKADFEIKASGDIGAASDKAAMSLAVQRLDGPGALSATGSFVPKSGAVSFRLNASETGGGLIARLARIPGLPPVAIDARAEGVLDNLTAALDARAGDVSAKGGARILREGAGRRIDLDLDAQIAALLPPTAAALFDGRTKISGRALAGDDGGVKLDSFSLAARAFDLKGTGALGADGALDAELSLRGAPLRPEDAFRAKTLTADARIGGSLARPNADLTAQIEDAEGPFGAIGRVDLTARASTDRDRSDPAARIDLQMDGAASGLALTDAALSQALGDNARLSFRGRANGAGEVDVGAAHLALESLEADFNGKAGPETLAGRLKLTAPDLGRFARLAGRNLRGALNLTADLTGRPAQQRVAAVIDGAVVSPAIGVAAIDGLAGARLSIAGKVATAPDGGVAFDRVILKGEHVTATLDGQATREKVDVAARIVAPDLRHADARISGRAEIDAHAKGAYDKLDAGVDARLSEARAQGRAIPKLDLKAQARDVTGAMQATATLDGVIDGKAARGTIAARRDGARWSVEPLDNGRVRVRAAELSVMLDSYREIPVASAGQLPTGFEPAEQYNSRFHPRGLQLAILGASDAIQSLGIDWDLVAAKAGPDRISVYASSAMSQLDPNG